MIKIVLAVALTLTGAPTSVNTALPPTSLKVAGQAADALIDTPAPALSWAPRDSGRDETQSAYEIKVSDVTTARRTVWDSSRVASDRSAGVAYGGTSLKADRTYEWTVRTWNKQGKASGWAAAQRFDAGPMAAGDWNASWLQVADGSLARRTFDVPRKVVRARLYLGAQGLAEPHLNGQPADPDRLLDSSVTDYAKRVVYRDFDVTSLIRPGANVLGVLAGQGQAAGKPTFVARLSLTYADGSSAVVASDAHWTGAPGPVTKDDFYYGESWDQRRLPAGWDTARFDASGWAAVPVYQPVALPVSLAAGKPVTALDETACCGWSRAALVDGTPISTDGSEGYHSAIATTAGSPKWVQVDLGSSQAVHGITLFPARPTNDTAGDFPGDGFPVRYKVEVSDDPGFATATTVVDRTAADQANPGNTPVSFTVPGVSGRYVRVTATVLACRSGQCTFRLAELGVYGASPAVGFGLTRLEADATPPTRIVGTVAPVKVTAPSTGVRVYDFGQNYVGQVSLRASAPAGTTVSVTKGELLTSAGQVSTANISFSDSDPARQLDTYTFDGSGTQTWMPRLNYAGFRYASIAGLPAGTAVTVSAKVIHSDVASAGTFSTSNPLLDRIQGAVVQTQLNDLQGMPLDCPTREKRGWLGDAGDTSAEAMANLDLQSLYTKWLADIRTSANADGSVPSVAPDQGEGDRFFTDPAWGTAFPQITWDSYVQYGDPAVLRDNYDAVKHWVDYLGTISDADHVVTRAPGSWGDDWLSTVSTPHVYFQTLFYLLDSRLLAKMAGALGNAQDAATYTALASAIQDGFTRRYADATPDTQLAYAMPLVLGVLTPERAQQFLGRLIADIAAHDMHVTTGFVGTTFVYQALGLYHRNDVALALAERTDGPSFGYMLANGPGTIWEKWTNSSAADGTSSKDHIGLAGSIGQWYYQQLAGIQPGTPGWRTFTLAPSVVGDLTRVSATQDTVRGTIASSWTRSGSTLTYRVSVPVGSTAALALPLLGGAGSTVLSDGHVVRGTITGSTMGLTLGSGSYTFTVLPPRTPVASVSVVASSSPAPVTPGRTADFGLLVSGFSTSGGSAVLSGPGVTSTPSAVALGPAPAATLVTGHVAVAAGTPSGRYPVTVIVRGPGGTTASATVDVLVNGVWPAGTTAAASSFHAPNVVDGATRTYDPVNAIDGNTATFWNDDTADAYPDVLTVTSPAAVALHGVGLSSSPDGVPTAFTVETWDGTAWTVRASVSDQGAVYRWVPFSAPVTTTQVRVVVTAAQASYSRIAELTP